MPIGAGVLMGAGAVTSLAGGLFKKKPKIPAYQKVDQTKEQANAIASNLASFEQSKQLADQTAQADQERLESILSRTIPNYRQMLSSSGEAIQNMIGGNLPNQDMQVLMRRSAERGSRMGLGGSAAGRNLTARDLGLSSLQMTQSGLNAFNQFSSNLRQNYTVNPMSTSSMYVSPSQRISNAMQDNQFAYNAAVGRAQSNAANSWQTRLGGFAQSAGGMMMGAGLQKWANAGSNNNNGGSNVGGAFGSSGIPYNPTYSLPSGYAGPRP